MVVITLTKLKEKTPWRWRRCIEQCRSTYDIHKIVTLLALATDLRGVRRNASLTLSMLSSDTRGRPGLLPLHKHPVSTNRRYHLVMLLLHDAHFLNHARNSRCTKITDLDISKRSSQKAFSCCDAILETGPATQRTAGQLSLLTVYVVPV